MGECFVKNGVVDEIGSCRKTMRMAALVFVAAAIGASVLSVYIVGLFFW